MKTNKNKNLIAQVPQGRHLYCVVPAGLDIVLHHFSVEFILRLIKYRPCRTFCFKYNIYTLLFFIL